MATVEEMKATAKAMNNEDLLTEFGQTVVWMNEVFRKDAFGKEHRDAMRTLTVIHNELLIRLGENVDEDEI